MLIGSCKSCHYYRPCRTAYYSADILYNIVAKLDTASAFLFSSTASLALVFSGLPFHLTVCIRSGHGYAYYIKIIPIITITASKIKQLSAVDF